MSYDVSKLTNLGQMKSALLKIKSEVTAAKSIMDTATISPSNWTAYDSGYKYANILAAGASNYHYYDVHLAAGTSNSISIMCANAEIRAKIESGKINLYCNSNKPTQAFVLEIITIPTNTNDVGIEYDIGDDFLTYPAITDALDQRLTVVETAVNTTIPAQINSIETTLQDQIDSLDTELSDAIANQVLIYLKPSGSEGISIIQSRWQNSSGTGSYSKKAVISMTGVTADYYPVVQFRDEDSQIYEFAPFATTGEGTVTIYCKTLPTTEIFVPSIICYKGTLVNAAAST